MDRSLIYRICSLCTPILWEGNLPSKLYFDGTCSDQVSIRYGLIYEENRACPKLVAHTLPRGAYQYIYSHFVLSFKAYCLNLNMVRYILIWRIYLEGRLTMAKFSSTLQETGTFLLSCDEYWGKFRLAFKMLVCTFGRKVSAFDASVWWSSSQIKVWV